MTWTVQHHTRLCWVNTSFAPIFIALCSIITNLPVPVILTQGIETPETLTIEEKKALIQNASMDTNTNQTRLQSIPLLLHFTSHTLDIQPLIILIALLTLAYSILSRNTMANDNFPYTTDTGYDLLAISNDTTLLILDSLFWAFFVSAHLTIYLFLIRITTLDAINAYIFLTLSTTWALSNRIVQKHPPALVIATALLISTHLQAAYDITQRNVDMWLPYFLLVTTGIVLVMCHTMDAILTPEVVHNCRITFITIVDLLLIVLILFLSN